MFKDCSYKLLDEYEGRKTTGYTHQIRLNYFITNPLNLFYTHAHTHTHTHILKICIWASLVTQTVRNLPAMQETQLQSLDQEDPLEKGMVTNSSILAWRITRTEEPGGL